MKKVSINSFSGGIVNDPRTPSSNSARMVSNFDILTDPYRMVAVPGAESGNTNQSTNKIRNYCIARLSGTGASAVYALYGLGISGTGTNRAEVFYKNINSATGSSNSLDDSNWTETLLNVSSNDNMVYDLFVYYQRTGLIYGARANAIWSYDPTGAAFTESVTGSFTYTFIGQGVVHPQTDVLYIPYYYDGAGTAANIVSAIASKNGTDDINPAAFSLPKHLRARSVAAYGNYLAIACEDVGVLGGNSKVIIWDLGSTKASETIDWGSERLFVLDDINGTLVGVSISSINAEKAYRRGNIVFRYLSVSSAIKFAELTSIITTALIPSLVVFQQKINNRLYFLAKIALGNSDLVTASPIRHGVWSVGGRPGNWTITLERTTDNDTVFTSANLALLGFYFVGDFLFISYTNSSTDIMSKTKNSGAFTLGTSIWESTINPNMPLQDRIRKKQVMAVAVHYEPLPSGGQVVLKYRVDAATAWASATTLFTEATDGVVITEKNTPMTVGREYEFRIESTGGAVITGFDYSYILKETQL